ncbi:MAG TPA: DUF1837 domain-containing protein [Verrucomicrobiae bacterium]|jgi:hypothetical protein
MDDKRLPDLGPLLTPQKEFGVVVKQAVESQTVHAPRVDLLFVRFKEATPDENGLAEVVCNQVINYAIPKNKIIEVQKQAVANPSDVSIWSKIVSEARRAFIAYKPTPSTDKPQSRYSEVGEVIAFCVASHFLNAGQVAAKMALKTNSEMPVYGLDGIHVKVETDGILTVFCLESKMVGNAKSGGEQYAKSAAGFAKDRKHKLNEQRIARDLSNLDILDGAVRESALAYFDPYSEEQGKVRERFVGIIIYDEPGYIDKLTVTDAIPIDTHQKHFVAKFESLHGEFSQNITTALKNQNVEAGTCRAFFLAVPSTARLKELFSKEMSNDHIRQ